MGSDSLGLHLGDLLDRRQSSCGRHGFTDSVGRLNNPEPVLPLVLGQVRFLYLLLLCWTQHLLVPWYMVVSHLFRQQERANIE